MWIQDFLNCVWPPRMPYLAAEGNRGGGEKKKPIGDPVGGRDAPINKFWLKYRSPYLRAPKLQLYTIYEFIDPLDFSPLSSYLNCIQRRIPRINARDFDTFDITLPIWYLQVRPSSITSLDVTRRTLENFWKYYFQNPSSPTVFIPWQANFLVIMEAYRLTHFGRFAKYKNVTKCMFFIFS